MDNQNKIAYLIKQYRKAQGLSQQELAEKAGISRIAVLRYENQQQEPSIQILEKIAKALNISMLKFIDWAKIEAHNLEDEPITKILEKNGFDIYQYVDHKNENAEPYIEILNNFRGKVYNISLEDYRKLQSDTIEYIEFKLEKYSAAFSANQSRPTATDNKPTDQ